MSRGIAPPTDLWKVARIEAGPGLTAEQRATLIGWVSEISGLTVEDVATNIRPWALITQSAADKSYRLHITRFVTDDEGRLIVDHALDEGAIQTEPLVYVIPAVPDWVLPLYQQQLTTIGGQ